MLTVKFYDNMSVTGQKEDLLALKASHEECLYKFGDKQCALQAIILTARMMSLAGLLKFEEQIKYQ